MDLTADADFAAKLAEQAGKLLLTVRSSSRLTAKALGQEGDKISHEFLVAALKAERPDDLIRSEEGEEAALPIRRSRLWIVDPLDGTREYSEGRDDWAVHVGLSVDGFPAAGAVALPGRNEVYSSSDPTYSKLTGGVPRMVISRSRPSAECLRVSTALEAEVIEMGSAGAKAMAVIRGDADIYLHSGGQYEWDSCAPAAVAVARGLHVSRACGAPIVYGASDPWLPDLLICHPDWRERVLSAWHGID